VTFTSGNDDGNGNGWKWKWDEMGTVPFYMEMGRNGDSPLLHGNGDSPLLHPFTYGVLFNSLCIAINTR